MSFASHSAPCPTNLRHDSLTSRRRIGDRGGVFFEALAQRHELPLVGHELEIVVREAVAGERHQAGGRRYVAARGIDADAALLIPPGILPLTRRRSNIR